MVKGHGIRNGFDIYIYKSSLELDRSWYICFVETIKEFDFKQNKDEPCVYKKVSGSAVVFLVSYVDDILLMGNDISILQISQDLAEYRRFSMKDLGEATYIFRDIGFI